MENSCISTVDQCLRFCRRNGQFSSSFLGAFLLDTGWGQTGLYTVDSVDESDSYWACFVFVCLALTAGLAMRLGSQVRQGLDGAWKASWCSLAVWVYLCLFGSFWIYVFHRLQVLRFCCLGPAQLEHGWEKLCAMAPAAVLETFWRPTLHATKLTVKVTVT